MKKKTIALICSFVWDFFAFIIGFSLKDNYGIGFWKFAFIVAALLILGDYFTSKIKAKEDKSKEEENYI